MTDLARNDQRALRENATGIELPTTRALSSNTSGAPSVDGQSLYTSAKHSYTLNHSSTFPSAGQTRTRFRLVLVRFLRCWCEAEPRRYLRLRVRRSLPVAGQERQFRGRSHAQSVQVAHLSRWCAGHLQGALAGIAIVPFALRPPLSGLEVVVDGPDQRRPLQTRV